LFLKPYLKKNPSQKKKKKKKWADGVAQGEGPEFKAPVWENLSGILCVQGVSPLKSHLILTTVV
jgi:hypothetical protein